MVLDGMDLIDAQWAVLEPRFVRPGRWGSAAPWAETRAAAMVFLSPST